MNYPTPLFILALIVLSAVPSAQAFSSDTDSNAKDVPLSPEEANEIVRREAEAKATQKIQRYAVLSDSSRFRVLESKKVISGQHRVILNRVVPPSFDQLSPTLNIKKNSRIKGRLLTAEKQRMLPDYPHKKHRMLLLSSTVYDRELTELRWYYKGQQYLAWSNVDFNNLRPITEIETEDAVYSLFLTLENKTSEDTKKRPYRAGKKGSKIHKKVRIPKLSAFTSGRAEYFVTSRGLPAEKRDAVYAPIDALHEYYDKNKERLKIVQQRRDALNEAREHYRARHPEEPAETILNFWPVRSSTY